MHIFIFNYGVPITKALLITNKPMAYQSAYEAVNNYYRSKRDTIMGNKLDDDWACTIRHHEKQLLYHLQMINTTNKPPPPPAKSPPPRPLVSSALPACTPSAKKSAPPSSKRKSVRFCSEQAARKAAIESLPAWTDQSRRNEDARVDWLNFTNINGWISTQRSMT